MSVISMTIVVVAFIAITGGIFTSVGTAPTTLLIFAGAFNGLLLPLGIGVMLWVAWARRDRLQGSHYLAINSVRPVINLFAG